MVRPKNRFLRIPVPAGESVQEEILAAPPGDIWEAVWSLGPAVSPVSQHQAESLFPLL